MKKLIFSALLTLTIPAYSQPATPPNEYNLKLTSAEIDILGEALGKLSYEKVAVLIQKIRQQIVAQQQPEPPKEAPK